MTDKRLNFLNDARLKLLLFSGKGGVGKTTTAVATALHRAACRPEKRVLILSTDPAHSLSDSLDQPLEHEITPVRGLPNLFAWEISANRLEAEFKQRNGGMLRTIIDHGTYLDQEDISDFLNLSLPGLDELMAVLEVARIVRQKQYDLVILDTAPTGHTLRLLALPRLMEEWLGILDLMLGKHRCMASLFGVPGPDKADAFVKSLSADLDNLRILLSDRVSTELVPVIIPEAMSIEETARLLEGTERLHLRVRSIVINRIIEQDGCAFCEARRKGQEVRLGEIESRFPAWTQVRAPLMPREARGQEAIGEYIQAILAEEPRLIPPLAQSGAVSFQPSRAPLETGDSLALGHQKILFFSGKGGVGKTTIAATAAIRLAREGLGHKTLLVSTDPAHSISDSLEQKIGSEITPVAGVEKLFALELDAAKQLQELKQGYHAIIEEFLDAFQAGSFDAPYDRQVAEALAAMTPPGLDELIALMEIMRLLDAGEFDRYVVDMAPTGHALRLLEMLGTLREWFTTLFQLLLKYQCVVPLAGMAAFLQKKSKQLRSLQKLLVDAEGCRFITVTTPEAMAVRETFRLLDRLGRLSIPCECVIANMVMPSTQCAFCGGIRDEQAHCLEELRTVTPSLICVPLMPYEVRGIDKLTDMIPKQTPLRAVA